MSKQILLDTLSHKSTARAPWVVFSGVHSGKLVGYDAEEVLTDGEKLFASISKVNELYKPDGQPIVFDLQIEAEILGCDLKWVKDSPPTVITHPLAQDMSVPTYLPTINDGRLPMIIDIMKRVTQTYTDTGWYGLVCGGFTLASHLRGTDIFMDMYDEPEYVHQLVDYCFQVSMVVSKMYIDAGVDIIGFVDPLISQISVGHFEEFLLDGYKDCFAKIRETGKKSSLFVCGDATRNVEVMCKTFPDCISVDENIDIAKAKETTDKYDIAIGGNIPLTTIMLHGTQNDNMKYTVELIKKMNCDSNFIVSPGCDMPYATPIENTIGVAEAVIHFEQTSKLVENYSAQDYSKILVDLPDYNHLSRPLVEVFTLDSESCAACTYMKSMAVEAAKSFEGKLDLVEYKFTVKENIARCIKMGVKNLPSLYIDGKMYYSSIIPSKAELEEKFVEAITNYNK